MRQIIISFPSGTIYIEHEGHKIPIKSLKRGKPYFLYYKEKQYLTEDEIKFVKAFL